MEEAVDYDKVVQSRLRALLRQADNRGGDKKDRELLRRAFKVALDAHKDVKRKTGEPYILHPIEVATIVTRDIGLGPQSIAAALLHDVIEDSEYTKEDLTHLFGEDIANMVEGLTKIQGIFDTQATSMQSENFRKLLLSISDDVRVILIKMADRLHNMRTLVGMPYSKQLKIASETLYIFAPLAHRMGLYNIKQEFEDLGLKYTEPEIYEELDRKLTDAQEDDSQYLKRFSNSISSLLRTERFEFQIKKRNKGIFSIRRKMLNQNVSFEEVYDKYAIRIIIDTSEKKEKADIWRAYSLITSIFRPNPRRLRDWITTPKANGYESLHITVMGPDGHWIEVQIRSKRMDEIAERGYAAHWRYKEDQSDNQALDAWVSKIRQAIEDQSESAIEFVDQFKLQLFSEEIFVFTPKGDMRTLPKRSTPLDFAFDIHSDLGMTTIGAKVNGKLVPLNHELGSGDQVQILTSTQAKPRTEWQHWVTTPKAKSRIRLYLKDQDRLAIERGESMLERMMIKAKGDFNQSARQKMTNFFGLRNPNEVFLRFGRGEYTSYDFREFLKEETGGFYNYLRRRFRPQKELLAHEETSKRIVFGPDEVVLEHQIADCCRPIPGDHIFGFIEDERIDVHRTDCRRSVQMQGQFADRIIAAKWAKGEQLGFNAKLVMTGTDRKGLIHNVTRVLSNELNVNIRSFNIEAQDGLFRGTIAVEVSDRSHLTSLTQHLRAIEGVERVDREVTPKTN